MIQIDHLLTKLTIFRGLAHGLSTGFVRIGMRTPVGYFTGADEAALIALLMLESARIRARGDNYLYAALDNCSTYQRVFSPTVAFVLSIASS